MLLLTKTEHVENVAHPISFLNAGARAGPRRAANLVTGLAFTHSAIQARVDGAMRRARLWLRPTTGLQRSLRLVGLLTSAEPDWEIGYACIRCIRPQRQ